MTPFSRGAIWGPWTANTCAVDINTKAQWSRPLGFFHFCQTDLNWQSSQRREPRPV